MKQIILFGKGIIGKRLLKYLGKEKVYAFCDNSHEKTSDHKGIKCLSYYDYIKCYSNYITILSVNSKHAREIINQLLNDRIDDFVVYNKQIEDMMTQMSSDDMFLFLNDDLRRMKLQKDYYYNLSESINNQFEYLKGVSDIHKLCRAKGYLSFVQRRATNFIKEVFSILEPLEIKIFTAAGTAIGLYRHNGYIPWDDDVDFGLMRDDYMKLLSYGKENFVLLEIPCGKDGDVLQSKCFREHPNEYIMIVNANGLQIKKGTSWMELGTIDFFPYDFYEDDYEYADHCKNIDYCSQWRRHEFGNGRMLQFIEDNAHTVNVSNHISFGLDGMDPYVCPRIGWMDRSVLLPLREVEFDGIRCYAPNRINEYLSYCFDEFEKYPDDLTAIHTIERMAIMKETYISCLIVVSDTQFEYLIDLYRILRKSGIYCVFLNNCKYLRQKNDYEKINEMLNDAEVEYIKIYDDEFDFYVSEKDIKFEEYFGIPGIISDENTQETIRNVKKLVFSIESNKKEMCLF